MILSDPQNNQNIGYNAILENIAKNEVCKPIEMRVRVERVTAKEEKSSR